MEDKREDKIVKEEQLQHKRRTAEYPYVCFAEPSDRGNFTGASERYGERRRYGENHSKNKQLYGDKSAFGKCVPDIPYSAERFNDSVHV